MLGLAQEESGWLNFLDLGWDEEGGELELTRASDFLTPFQSADTFHRRELGIEDYLPLLPL